MVQATAERTRTWNVDSAHSSIEFSVKHFFTPVKGRFEEYEVDLAFDEENPENSSVKARLDVRSIKTGNDDRDQHLLSEDFFAADEHPYITFESELVESVGEGKLIARGPLRIKDETQEVELPIQVLGVKDVPEEIQEALGGIEQAASFESELTINRNDYGVGVGSWAAVAVVGREVSIGITLEANR